MLEPKATRRELQDTNRTLAQTAIALASVVGALGAAIAEQQGLDRDRLLSNFRRIAALSEDQVESHGLLVRAVAAELQLGAGQSELQARQGAGATRD